MHGDGKSRIFLEIQKKKVCSTPTSFSVSLFTCWITQLDVATYRLPLRVLSSKVFASQREKEARARWNTIHCFVSVHLLWCVTSCSSTAVTATCHKVTGICRQAVPQTCPPSKWRTRLKRGCLLTAFLIHRRITRARCKNIYIVTPGWYGAQCKTSLKHTEQECDGFNSSGRIWFKEETEHCDIFGEHALHRPRLLSLEKIKDVCPVGDGGKDRWPLSYIIIAGAERIMASLKATSLLIYEFS